jgi:hypothetical protein
MKSLSRIALLIRSRELQHFNNTSKESEIAEAQRQHYINGVCILTSQSVHWLP